MKKSILKPEMHSSTYDHFCTKSLMKFYPSGRSIGSMHTDQTYLERGSGPYYGALQ